MEVRRTLRGRARALLLVAAMAGVWVSTTAAASAGPAPSASCLGIVVSWETTIEPGFVGREASSLARTGIIGPFASGFAKVKAGSVEACLAAIEE